MKLTPLLLKLTLVGAEWVLWVLIALSVLSVAVLFERGLFFVGLKAPVDALVQNLRRLLRAKDVEGARAYAKQTKGVEAEVLLAGLQEAEKGTKSMEDAMLASKARIRLRMERNLAFLGTLGSNAPFVGLFGTVLGIIKAFRDLSKNQAGGIGVIMSGISEALVATAVGLFVAIPAVVGYNFYTRLVRSRTTQIDAAVQDVLAALREEPETAKQGES